MLYLFLLPLSSSFPPPCSQAMSNHSSNATAGLFLPSRNLYYCFVFSFMAPVRRGLCRKPHIQPSKRPAMGKPQSTQHSRSYPDPILSLDSSSTTLPVLILTKESFIYANSTSVHHREALFLPSLCTPAYICRGHLFLNRREIGTSFEQRETCDLKLVAIDEASYRAVERSVNFRSPF